MARQKKIAYTQSLGRIIARGAKRSRGDRFHIISSIADGDKWSLVSEGSTKPIRVFTTKSAAINFAKKIDIGQKRGYLIIHGRDGRIQNKMSFHIQG